MFIKRSDNFICNGSHRKEKKTCKTSHFLLMTYIDGQLVIYRRFQYEDHITKIIIPK